MREDDNEIEFKKNKNKKKRTWLLLFSTMDVGFCFLQTSIGGCSDKPSGTTAWTGIMYQKLSKPLIG